MFAIGVWRWAFVNRAPNELLYWVCRLAGRMQPITKGQIWKANSKNNNGYIHFVRTEYLIWMEHLYEHYTAATMKDVAERQIQWQNRPISNSAAKNKQISHPAEKLQFYI